MDLVNMTNMPAAFSVAMDRAGRELLVVVVKGTFGLPAGPETIRLAPQQVPLAFSDSFTGEPGQSAPLVESDFAPEKLNCDVLLNGSAYAPAGRPVTRVEVAMLVGAWSKRLIAVGDREWQVGLGPIVSSFPRRFARQPLSYDYAFGGVDDKHEDTSHHHWYTRNPVGRGYRRHMKREWLDGTALPNTEGVGAPVTAPDGSYAPMAYGPIGRHWEPRFRLAGTYDRRWLDEVFPFLPGDFNELYYQAAPSDQQVPRPVEGMRVALINLTPDGQRVFDLPKFQAAVTIIPKSGPREHYAPTVDTVFFEPDQERFTMSWRVSRPLRRDIFEIAQITVGNRWPKVPTVVVESPAPAAAT